jgi:hypothetical protein
MVATRSALSHCYIEHVTNRLARQAHAAATTSRHVCIADALKARCVLADVRWRWKLKVLRAAACTERNLCADPTLPDRGRSRHQSAFAIRSRVVARSEAGRTRTER